MCLKLTIDSKKMTESLKERENSIIAYKILNPDMTSGFRNFQWKIGLNISDRKSTQLTKDETHTGHVYEGFHLTLDIPQGCPHQSKCITPDYCLVSGSLTCLFAYKHKCLATKTYECKIDPEDIISIGTWYNIESIVAIQVTLLDPIQE